MPESEFIFDTLKRSNAQLHGHQSVNQHYGLAYWSNDFDRVTYQADRVHTLSYYATGGEGSRRLDVNTGFGQTNTVSLLPQFHYSDWEISKPFHFAHLYFSDESIKQFAAMTLDIEPRIIQVPELIFNDDRQLVVEVKKLFAEGLLQTPLAYEQHIQTIFSQLLSDTHYCIKKESSLTGGLSPRVLKRVRDFMQANLHTKIQLNDLAEQANLSAYHFLRMFQLSTGFTPNDYIQFARIENVKRSLSPNNIEAASLAAIAAQNGFSHQSHLSRVFKKYVGVTPGQYRKIMESE